MQALTLLIFRRSITTTVSPVDDDQENILGCVLIGIFFSSHVPNDVRYELFHLYQTNPVQEHNHPLSVALWYTQR